AEGYQRRPLPAGRSFDKRGGKVGRSPKGCQTETPRQHNPLSGGSDLLTYLVFKLGISDTVLKRRQRPTSLPYPQCTATRTRFPRTTCRRPARHSARGNGGIRRERTSPWRPCPWH